MQHLLAASRRRRLRVSVLNLRVFRINLLAFAAALLFTAHPACAQDRDSILNIAQHSNWYVRLITPAATLEGRGVHVVRDSVLLRESRVAQGDITAIDRRIRRGGGAMTGGIFGALVAATFVHGLYRGLCEGSCNGSDAGALIGGAGMGFAVGAPVGAMVARGKPEWHRQFPMTDVPQQHQSSNVQDTSTAVATGTFTVTAGGGMLIEAAGEGAALVKRISLQLAFPTSKNSTVEAAAEPFIMLFGDSGLLGVTLGPNFTTTGHGYFGFSAGAAAFVDDWLYDVGARVGLRPGNHGVLRPEARADVIWRNGETAVSITASLGLQLR